LRAILDTASGDHPLPSIVGAMFLLGTQATYSLIQSFNSGTQFATVDVLDSLWTYIAGTIMPIAAGLAIVGSVINFATHRPAMRLVAVALAMLCVSGIWKIGSLHGGVGASMSFTNGILNLTNWTGNVILPTLAGLFFAIAILRFSRGESSTHAMYGGFLFLMVSGLLRAMETFASQRAWSDPDVYFISLLSLVKLDLQCADAGVCGHSGGGGRHAHGNRRQNPSNGRIH